MADNKWSENQPPEWTGAPIGSTPPPEAWQPPTAPPVADAPASTSARRRFDIGQALREVWTVISGRFVLFIGGSAVLVLVSILLASALAAAMFPAGISPDALSILDGSYGSGDDAGLGTMTDAELNALITAIGEASTVLSLGFLPILLIQFVFGSAITRIALNDPAEPRMSLRDALTAVPFGKVFSSGVAVAVLLGGALVGLILASTFSLLIPAIGPLILIAVVLAGMVWMVWLGLGISQISAVAIGENIGGFAAIKRSLALSKGRRWPIFGLLIIVGLVASMPINVVASGILVLSDFNFVSYYISSLLPLVLSVPANAALASVIYKNLR